MSSLSAWPPLALLCLLVFFLCRATDSSPPSSSLSSSSSFVSSRNSKLELELAQVRADFERLKSQDSTKSERLEELS